MNPFAMEGRIVVVTGAEIPVDGGQTSHGGPKFISDALR